MFIAMNRFRVAKGSEANFEQVWLSRDSHLEKVPGFVEFHLLKGPEAEDYRFMLLINRSEGNAMSAFTTSRCLVAFILVSLLGGQSFTKGGGNFGRGEDRYNPDHIESLPPEIRNAIYLPVRHAKGSA
jgi:hypothetical protein